MNFATVTRAGVAVALSLATAGIAAQDGMKWESLKTASFEIYAPEAADIERARPELEYAASQFQKYFGVEPPKIAVVLTNDTRGAAPVVGDIAARGVPVLNWLTDSAWAARHGGVATHSESQILPHEACHLFLVAYVNRKTTKDGAGAKATTHYGHPQIPDWFDEGVASLCERPDMQERRRAGFARELDKRVPLDELFTMPHPLAAGIPVRFSAEDRPKMKPGTYVGAVTFTSGQVPQELISRSLRYYLQVFSVIDYLSQRAEPNAMRIMADRMAEGATTREALKDVKGLPTLNALESDWLSSVTR
ncbi:MAG: hypothetical protein M3468_08245 [Acidobacteriota bacterium]|nr:hypothetical protein [Acidobacteriota bacterium]